MSEQESVPAPTLVSLLIGQSRFYERTDDQIYAEQSLRASMDMVATGTPGGICTVESRASSPWRAACRSQRIWSRLKNTLGPVRTGEQRAAAMKALAGRPAHRSPPAFP